MHVEFILTLIVLGVVAALAGLAWLHGHKAGVESGINAGVKSAIDKV